MQATNIITPTEQIEQHSLKQTTALHLLPGVLILAVYLIATPIVMGFGFPALFALMLAVLFAALPSQLGHLLSQGKKRNGRLSLQGIVLYREPIPVWQYFVIVPALIIWSFVCLFLLTPLDTLLQKTAFAWLPVWFFYGDPTQYAHYARPVLIITLVFVMLLNGLAAPIVEELYFRGYLLPRLARFKGRAPLINLLLFTLYHFWQPWQYPSIIVSLLALVYAAWWKRNIYLSLLTHGALNLIGGLATIGLILSQMH